MTSGYNQTALVVVKGTNAIQILLDWLVNQVSLKAYRSVSQVCLQATNYSE